VIVSSDEIPATGRVFHESVKISTSESLLPTDDATLKLSPLQVFAPGTRIQPQYFRSVTDRQELLTNPGTGLTLFLVTTFLLH
jgi:hypothetical protein